MENIRKLIESALAGNGKSTSTIILLSPSGHKGAMSDDDYVQKLSDDEGFFGEFAQEAESLPDEVFGPEDDDEPEDDADDKEKVIADVLRSAIDDESVVTETARAVCKALKG